MFINKKYIKRKRVAAAFRISVQVLLSLNPNLNCQSLPVGQQICVPSIDAAFSTSPNPIPLCSYYYTLSAGDTCDSIVAAYQTNIQAILSINPNLNCQFLTIGQQICVPPLDQNTFPTNPVNPFNPGCSSYYILFAGDSCDR